MRKGRNEPRVLQSLLRSYRCLSLLPGFLSPLILSFPSVVLPVPPCSRRTLASRLISSVRPEGPGSARHEGNEGGNDRGNRVTGARDLRDRTEMSRE